MRISAADSSTWEEVPQKKASGKEDEESFAIVEECVMKSTAGGCSSHERCDLSDYDRTRATCHRISHTKTKRHLPKEGCGRCIQPRVRDC